MGGKKNEIRGSPLLPAKLAGCHTQHDLPVSHFTTDQAEALQKLLSGCQIALIKRYV